MYLFVSFVVVKLPKYNVPDTLCRAHLFVSLPINEQVSALYNQYSSSLKKKSSLLG